MKTFFSLAVLALVVPSFAACSSSSSDAGNGSCSSIAGTWSTGGSCGPDVCVITQNGCNTSFSCGGGSRSYTGSVEGTSVSYSGKTVTGADGTCQGTLQGSTISGTCSVQGATCDFNATKQ